MTLSNEHLVRAHLEERLAAAMTHRARRRVADDRPEPHRSGGGQRILPTLILSLHSTRKGKLA